ncbi:MAG: hypothetical protein KGM98_12190 [Bacteroidota bacterium]|nr:hypothetical protein [Bacteroidota bacterium]
MKHLKSLVLIGITSLSLMACKKNNATYQPKVSNNTDNFTFQANNTTNLSSNYDYSWNNTGQTATITVTSTITTGTANISIYDANGSQVYTNDIQTNGTFTTSTGVSGIWKIHVTLSGADGNVSFTVQKN